MTASQIANSILILAHTDEPAASPSISGFLQSSTAGGPYGMFNNEAISKMC